MPAVQLRPSWSSSVVETKKVEEAGEASRACSSPEGEGGESREQSTTSAHKAEPPSGRTRSLLRGVARCSSALFLRTAQVFISHAVGLEPGCPRPYLSYPSKGDFFKVRDALIVCKCLSHTHHITWLQWFGNKESKTEKKNTLNQVIWVTAPKRCYRKWRFFLGSCLFWGKNSIKRQSFCKHRTVWSFVSKAVPSETWREAASPHIEWGFLFLWVGLSPPLPLQYLPCFRWHIGSSLFVPKVVSCDLFQKLIKERQNYKLYGRVMQDVYFDKQDISLPLLHFFLFWLYIFLISRNSCKWTS